MINKLLLPLHIPEVEPPDGEHSKEGAKTKSGRNIITHHDVWLFVGGESEDWNPGSEDVCESIHL